MGSRHSTYTTAAARHQKGAGHTRAFNHIRYYYTVVSHTHSVKS